MADPARRSATYEDLCALPRNMVGQTLYGVLYAHARPAPRHAGAMSNLGGELNPRFHRGRGGPDGSLIRAVPFDTVELELGALWTR